MSHKQPNPRPTYPPPTPPVPPPPVNRGDGFALDDFCCVGDTATTTTSDGGTITIRCDTPQSVAYANSLILSKRWKKVTAPNKETDA